MSKTVIGRNLPLYKGEYDSTKTYDVYDVVLSNGSSYASKKKNNVGNDLTNTEFWQLLAKNGEFTEEDKETFKQAVVEESKTTINEHTKTKKTELDTYTTNLKTSLETELDTYEGTKETELDTHKDTLETEMTNTKNSLVKEIEDAQNGFDNNVTAQTIEFNSTVTKQTNVFNSNAETKITDFDTNANTKKTEYDDNATTKLQEYNDNSTDKVIEFNENAESYEKRIAELETERDEVAEQMPWNTTDISESIHVEDSAKYSRNKLNLFGNLKQETRAGYNLFKLPESATKNGIDYNKNEDGTFNIVGTATQQAIFSIVVPSEKSGFIEGESYTISSNNVIGDVRYYIHNCNSEGAWNKTQLDFINETTKTKVFGESTTNYISCNIVVPLGITVNLTNVKVQVVKGTEEKDWEPHGEKPSPDYPSMPVVATGVQQITKIGKNLLKCNTVANHVTVNDDGSILINGKGGFYISTNSITFKPNTKYTQKIELVSGTISGTIDSNSIQIVGSKGWAKINGITTFSYSEETTLLSMWCNDNAIFNNVVLKISVYEGENDELYEQYDEEIFRLDLGTTELCKITDSSGNVIAQDRAVYREVDGVWKWQWEKKIEKYIFTGNENTHNRSNSSTTHKKYLWINILPHKILSEYSLICSHFVVGNANDAIISVSCICGNTTSGYERYINVSIENEIASTNTEMTNYLKEQYNAGTPVTIRFALETPLYEDCTAEQSAVLDKLYRLQLEKGTNNIIVESENGVTTELQLTYMQDLQSKLNTLEAMCVSNASEEV